jgi:hypothetical protein
MYPEYPAPEPPVTVTFPPIVKSRIALDVMVKGPKMPATGTTGAPLDPEIFRSPGILIERVADPSITIMAAPSVDGIKLTEPGCMPWAYVPDPIMLSGPIEAISVTHPPLILSAPSKLMLNNPFAIRITPPFDAAPAIKFKSPPMLKVRLFPVPKITGPVAPNRFKFPDGVIPFATVVIMALLFD